MRDKIIGCFEKWYRVLRSILCSAYYSIHLDIRYCLGELAASTMALGIFYRLAFYFAALIRLPERWPDLLRTPTSSGGPDCVAYCLDEGISNVINFRCRFHGPSPESVALPFQSLVKSSGTLSLTRNGYLTLRMALNLEFWRGMSPARVRPSKFDPRSINISAWAPTLDQTRSSVFFTEW